MSFDKLPRASRVKFDELNDDVEETRARISVIQARIAGMVEKASIVPPLDLDRQKKRMADEQARFTSLMRVTTAIRTWILQLPGNVELEHVKAPSAPTTDEPVLEQILALREKVRVTQEEIIRTMRSVLPLPELLKQADAFVDNLAARGKPNIRTEGDALSIKWDTGSLHDAIHILAWLDPDILKKRLHADVERGRQAYDLVLTTQERKTKVAALEKQKMEYERLEEHLIVTGDVSIFRREDASPMAILGIEIVRRKVAAA